MVEDKHSRRPDVVLFVNGLPLAVLELKNAADEDATIWTAFHQLQTYKAEIPSLFATNAVLVVSDGVEARVGTLTAGREWFKPWRTDRAARSCADPHMPELQVLIEGVFAPRRFLDLVRDFIVFEDDGGGRARQEDGRLPPVPRRAGGGGRDAARRGAGARATGRRMRPRALRGRPQAGRQARRPARRRGLAHPGLGQEPDHGLLRRADHPRAGDGEPDARRAHRPQRPGRPALRHVLALPASCCASRRCRPRAAAHLRELLQVASGGVVFTTIQKFFPEEKGDRHPMLSDRRNIVVIADEAHRSQYDFIDGFARHMRDALPNASFIGFTGTPIELTDENTRAVFGDYISVYDIQRAVEDGATVPIYYESRLAKLALDEAERPKIDAEFEEVTEGEEVERKEKLKTQVGAARGDGRRREAARAGRRDIVEHFEKRLEAMDGKAMVVCMSRRICVELYDAIVELRPDWHDEDDDKGAIKVVMTGSASDPLDWQPHIRNKPRREELAKRFSDPNDPLQDGASCATCGSPASTRPSLHTMYVDKPMRGHGLMQAIARVNRVFRDKPGGLVVDYLGLADELKQALATYTESGGTGETAIDQDEAVAVMLEKYEVCCGLFHGFDWSQWTTGTPQERLRLLPAGPGAHPRPGGRQGPLRAGRHASSRRRSRWPCRTRRRCAIRDDVAFFQAVRAVLAKRAPGDAQARGGARSRRPPDRLARRSRPDEVVDIFAAAGLEKPDISILSDEFLAEVRGMPQRNLAVELLRKLLKGEIRTRATQERGAGALVRRDAGADASAATRTAPSRRRRSSRS